MYLLSFKVVLIVQATKKEFGQCIYQQMDFWSYIDIRYVNI